MAFESANHSVKAKTSVIKTRLHNNKTLGAQLKLDATNEIEWTTKEKFPEIESATVYFGAGSTSSAMQVATGQASSLPSRGTMKRLFSDRKGKNSTSNLMVVIEFGDDCAIFGPDPDSELLVQTVSNARNFLNSVLAQENGIYQYHRAISIRRSLQTTDMVGFTNNGLFASHYIRTSASSHPKWQEAQQRSASLQNLRDRELITSLGFEVTASPSNTLLLSAQGQDKRVVAILLDQSEHFDSNSPRFQGSPVEWGLDVAQQQGAPWVIAVRDSQIRLYPAKDGVGVGQKSQVETYFEIDLLTIDEDKIGLIDLVFSAEALSEGGTADELLVNSQKFASALGVRLRERVYESIVPALATEIANQLRTKGFELDAKGLQRAYELTLRVLFRLLFQAYAEDRGLLPSGRNEIFDSNSMKHWGNHLLKRDNGIEFGDSSSIWFDMMQVWDAIDQGNPDMQIPAYNGGLFGTDQELHPDGYLIRSLSIPDRVMGPALRALVIDDNTEDGVAGAVDFRSLSVREFGTIYEGLLESSLSVADQDLTVDKKGAWVPAKDSDQVIARANEVYFHSASGERKATGSYYTPSFIVDHLIERSVEPALNDHLAKVKLKLEADDQAGAYAAFFDFRVADLAMGSAHFLVAAIDKIETVMRSFLIQEGNQIDGVNAELLRLEAAAKAALGPDEAAYAEIERASLLRRQIARRCIYGLDINPLAVELSRLAIWIHTFVPGLPMSSLEHNLVCANSLTGIGSVEEGLNALIPDREKFGTSLFDGLVESSLQEAKTLLEDVANADEADKKEAKQAAQAAKLARHAAAKSKMIFDVAVANRNGVVSSGAALTESDLEDLASNQELIKLIDSIQPAHMPYLFPEVFLRSNPGFDVLVGNPPWEKVEFDLAQMMAMLFPGFKALPQGERESRTHEFLSTRPDRVDEIESKRSVVNNLRRALLNADYPGLGMDHPDFAKAFAWRFTRLARKNGTYALVLPKTIFSGRSMEPWRRHILEHPVGTDITFLANKGEWVFEGVHGQKEFALVSHAQLQSKGLTVSGPFDSLHVWRASLEGVRVPIVREMLGEKLEVPSTLSPESWAVMAKMRNQKNFDASPLYCKTVYETDGTKDKKFFDFTMAAKIPVLKGGSFDLWEPQKGVNYASIEPEVARKLLWGKLSKSAGRANSPFSTNQFSYELLPMDLRRIAYRWTTNSTNSRTMVASFVGPGVVLTNQAPYLIPHQDESKNEALLGVLSSRVFDWYVRRFVEGTMRQGILNAMPFPELDDKSIGQISEAVQLRLRSKEPQDFIELESHIDHLVARAYGLDTRDLSVIFSSFHPTWRYQPYLDLVTSASFDGRI